MLHAAEVELFDYTLQQLFPCAVPLANDTNPSVTTAQRDVETLVAGDIRLLMDTDAVVKIEYACRRGKRSPVKSPT
ncbi:hypothetical protein FQZ97_449310 [compost metagenome]